MLEQGNSRTSRRIGHVGIRQLKNKQKDPSCWNKATQEHAEGFSHVGIRQLKNMQKDSVMLEQGNSRTSRRIGHVGTRQLKNKQKDRSCWNKATQEQAEGSVMLE